MTISMLTLKRFFREYAVALGATLLFIILLAGLLVSRHYALAGLGDLSKINPLINAQKSQLVGRDKTVGVTADQETSDNSTSTDTTQKTPQQQSAAGNSPQNNTSTSGQTNQPTSSGGGTANPPGSPAPQFAVSIGTMTHVAGSPSGVLGVLNPTCTITHQFNATIHAVNGPGTMGYVWAQSNGTTSPAQSKSFSSGSSDDQVTYQWTITARSGSYWIKLSVGSPNQTEQTLNFNHQCVL